MTATGIVRRIDDLGRVVIPKELRRKLKWRPGAPVEIFTAPDGIVSLKKYTYMGEDSILAQKLADSMAQSSKCVVMVTDMDQVIAASGSAKAQLLEKSISVELENAIHARNILVIDGMHVATDCPVYPHAIIAPIVSGGDAEGAVVMLSKDTGFGDNEVMLAKTMALFLSNYIDI